MNKIKLLTWLVAAGAATSILLSGCNNDVGDTTPSLKANTALQESHPNLGCIDPEDELCDSTIIHLDGYDREMHQQYRLQPKYGNFFGDNIPMLMSFRNDYVDWSMQHYKVGGNRNFDWNIAESSFKFVDPNPSVGCLGKTVIKKGETCYLYAIAHIKLANENLAKNNFGARFYYLYQDEMLGLGNMNVNMSPIQTVQSIRQIMDFESQYFTPEVQQHLNQYQIVRLQNISYSESKVLEIQPHGISLRNHNESTFMLQERASAGDDPLYGQYAQCAAPENVSNENKKVSSLKKGEECILVFKAADKSAKSGKISDTLDFKTNATATPNIVNL